MKQTYDVLKPLPYNGRWYKDTIDLTERQALPLLLHGKIQKPKRNVKPLDKPISKKESKA